MKMPRKAVSAPSAPAASMEENQRGITPMDVHIGGRIRIRRSEVGVSAERVAQMIGLSRQQLDKLEMGRNRVTVGRLADIAQVLHIAPGWFFEQFAPSAMPTNGSPILDKVVTPSAISLIAEWNKLNKEQRDMLRKMIDALVQLNQMMGVAVEEAAEHEEAE